MASAVAHAIQRARKRNVWVFVCLTNLRVKFGHFKAFGRLYEHDWLKRIAPAHGLVANVWPFFAIDGVDAELQLIVWCAVLAVAHEPRQPGSTHLFVIG